MVTREELFSAVRLIKSYCKSRDECEVFSEDSCPFSTQSGSTWCALNNCVPCSWPDPEEGGGEDGDE